jgi:hypothetical protein
MQPPHAREATSPRTWASTEGLQKRQSSSYPQGVLKAILAADRAPHRGDYFAKVDEKPKQTYDILKGDKNVNEAAELDADYKLSEGADTALGARLGRSGLGAEVGRSAGRAVGRATPGEGRAGAYQAFLERSGFDTSQYRQPVLIARRLTPMSPDDRAAFAQSADASASLRMSTTEQAASDARTRRTRASGSPITTLCLST